MKRSRMLVVGMSAVLATLGLTPAIDAGNASFANGDVFAGVGGSTIQWRHPDGSFNKNLTTPVSMPSTTGMAFDLSGNLYVTGFTSNAVGRFDTSGAAIGTFGTGYSAHPKSIAFDALGGAFVGLASGSRDVLKFDAAGSLLASFDVGTEKKGADWIDLAADQKTIFYTSGGKAIKRFNTDTGQLADFVGAIPGKTAHAVRVLLDGGVLVAGTDAIYRYDAGGGLAQTYDVAGRDCWETLALGTTTSTFWAGDSCSSIVYEFNAGTGEDVIRSFDTGTRRGTVEGLAVFGGLTAATAGADLAVTKSDTPDPAQSGGFIQYTVTVTNNGPRTAGSIVVTDTLGGGSTFHSAPGAGSDPGWTCAATASGRECSLAGTLAAGSSSSFTVVALGPTVSSPTTVSNTAGVTSTAEGFFDPVSDNNSDTEETLVNDPASSPDAVDCFAPGDVPITCGTVFDVDENNNTGTQVEVPASGDAGLTSIREGATTFPCGGTSESAAQQVDFTPPPGLEDRTNPIHVVIKYDVTLDVTLGELTFICTIDKTTLGDEGGPTEIVVPACENPSWANEATPQIPSGACVHKIHQLGNGDWQVHVNQTFVDPPYRR